MGYTYRNGTIFYQRAANEPYAWEGDTGTIIKPIEYAAKKELKDLEETVENLRKFEEGTRSFLGQQIERIDAIEQAIGMDHWGNANELLMLKAYTEHLVRDVVAHNGTHKRRKVIVRAGNQVVEVARNG